MLEHPHDRCLVFALAILILATLSMSILSSTAEPQSQNMPVVQQPPYYLVTSAESGNQSRPVISLKLEVTRIPVEEERDLPVVVQNMGNATAEKAILDFYPGAMMVMESDSRFVVKNLTPGDAKVVKLKVRISKYATGPVKLWVRMMYWDKNGTFYTDYVQLSVEPIIPGSPNILLVPSDQVVVPDKINILNFSVVNYGGDADNVTVKLVVPSQVGAIIGPNTEFAGEVKRGERENLSIQVYVFPGVYGALEVEAYISYRDFRGVPDTSVQTFGYRVRGSARIAVSTYYTNPTPVFPGDRYVRLVVVINNIGDYVARDVWVNLSLPKGMKPSFAGSCAIKVPVLPTDKPVELTYRIDLSDRLAPGIYRMKVMTDKAGNSSFYITVDEKAGFTVEGIFLSKRPTPGLRGEKIRIAVRNLGNATAKSVKVDLMSPFISGTTSVMLGDIPGGAEEFPVMEVDISKYAPQGNLTLEFHIEWNQDGRQLSEVVRKQIVVEREEGDFIPMLLMACLVVVLLITYKHPIGRRILKSIRGSSG